MSIDFNSDIAGLRGQFFPVGGLRDSEQRRMRKNYQEVIAPLQARSMELTNNLVRLEQQELAFDRSRADMREARRKAKQEKDALSRLPAVSAKLDTILTDPSKSSFDKARDINTLQRTMIGQITNSPQLSNLFTSARATADLDLKEQKRQEDIEDRANQENSRKLGLAYGLAQSGNVEATKKLVEGIPEGEAYVSFAEGVRAGSISSEDRKRLEDERKQQKDERDFFVQNVDQEIEVLTGFETNLESISQRVNKVVITQDAAGVIIIKDSEGNPIPPNKQTFTTKAKVAELKKDGTNIPQEGVPIDSGRFAFTSEDVADMKSQYSQIRRQQGVDADTIESELGQKTNIQLYQELLTLIRQKRSSLLEDRKRGRLLGPEDIPFVGPPRGAMMAPLVGPPRGAMNPPATDPTSLFGR